MAQINWTNVLAGRFPTGSAANSLAGARDAFRDLTTSVGKKRAAEAKARIAKAKADKKARAAVVDRTLERVSSKFVNNSKARLGKSELIAELNKDPTYKALDAEGKQGVQDRFLASITDENGNATKNIRLKSGLAAEMKNYALSNIPNLSDEILDSSIARANDAYFRPSATQKEADTKRETLDLLLAEEGKYNKANRVDLEELGGTLEANVPGMFRSLTNIGEFSPSRRDIDQFTSLLQSNGIRNKPVIDKLVSEVFTEGGTVKDKYDWRTDKNIRKKLVGMAKGYSVYRPPIDINAERAAIAASQTNSGVPTGVLAEDILQFLPQPPNTSEPLPGAVPPATSPGAGVAINPQMTDAQVLSIFRGQPQGAGVQQVAPLNAPTSTPVPLSGRGRRRSRQPNVDVNEDLSTLFGGRKAISLGDLPAPGEPNFEWPEEEEEGGELTNEAWRRLLQ